jgi:hypothetical protein
VVAKNVDVFYATSSRALAQRVRGALAILRAG